MPSLLLSNVRALTNKLEDLQDMASALKIDVIAITETWLHDAIDDSYMKLTNYSTPLRRDRQGRSGGGVCCYARHGIAILPVLDMPKEPSSIECLWVRLPNAYILLAITYVPPSLSAAQYDEVTSYFINCADFALDQFVNHRLILLGDFNRMCSRGIASNLSLTQVVECPTRGNVTLDKIFMNTDMKDLYHEAIVGPSVGTSDHLSVILRPRVSNQRGNHTISVHKVIDFRKSNLESLCIGLQRRPWHTWYRSDADIQEKTDVFYDWLDEEIGKLPTFYVELQSNDKPWISPLVKHLLMCKYQAFHEKNFPLYRHLKRKVQNMILAAKRNWLEKMKSHQSGIWKILPELNGRAASQKDGLSQLLQNYPSKHMAAESINENFCLSFSEPPDWTSVMSCLPQHSRSWDINISVQAVFSRLTQLNCKKSTGSDGIPPRVLRECATALTEPITHIFCLSVESQKIPQQWKVAHVIPVPKRRVVSLNDIRPISLLPIIFKVFESLVVDSIKEELIQSYGPEQFGFRPHSSTLLANIALTDCLAKCLEQERTVGAMVISFDMSRAFDRLKHSNLMATLKEHNLPLQFITWCSDFLQQRFQQVKLESVVSTLKPVTSGVPQGSRLSPYLFSSHMGSLKPSTVSASIFKYADDVLMVLPLLITSDIGEQFHCEVSQMKLWCSRNGLVLNEEKTNVMIVRKGIPLQPHSLNTVSSMRILGVTFQEDLKWDEHIENVIKIAARRIFVLRQLKRFPGITKEDIISVYCAYIRSIMEYNCPVFAGLSKKNAKKLESLQRRCHRIICSKECRCGILETLSDRRDLLCIRVLKSILHKDNILNIIAPTTLSRSKHLSMPFCRTQRYATTFIPYATALYNRSCV